MRKLTPILLILGVFLFALPAAAQSTRTALVVSPEGPYRSIQAALDQARPGDQIEVHGGRYPGPLVVKVAVTLVGVDFPVIDGGGEGSVVNLAAPGIVLQGFSIQNSGDSLDQENSGIVAEANNLLIENNRLENTLFGIYLREADHAILRGNNIRSKDLDLPRRGDPIRVWYSDDVLIEDNIIESGRDVVLWYSENLTVRNNTISGGRYGLHFMYCDDATIQSNLLIDNSVGAFLMYSRRLKMLDNTIAYNRGPSGFGVGMKDLDDAQVTGNLFFDNRVGAHIDNSPREIDSIGWFEGNIFGYNDIGISMMPSVRRNQFTNNSFIDNHEQVLIEGGGELKDNFWTVEDRGNYWSDYVGFDQDADGAGDLPYRAERLFEILSDRFPNLRLFTISPAAQAIDFAARAVPLVRPQPKLTDTLPLMAPENLENIPQLPRPDARDLSLASLTLLSLGLLSFLSTRLPLPNKPRPTPSPTAGETVMISTQKLSKRFGPLLAVDELSFQVSRGESVALWGPYGAGKTTILRCLLGLTPFTGEASVAGLDVRAQGREARRHIGFVPQELTFHHDLQVEETMVFYARLKKVAPTEIEKSLARIGLRTHAHKQVSELSGGMKQRLALAIALLGDPDLLLLDEPTSNLDADGRGELLALLAGLRESGKTLLFSSHRLDEVMDLADRVISLKQGRLIADCSPEQFIDQADYKTRVTLYVGKDQVSQAVSALISAGYSASPNGKRIWVNVPLHRKGGPIKALIEAGIQVRDFDYDFSEEADPANG